MKWKETAIAGWEDGNSSHRVANNCENCQKNTKPSPANSQPGLRFYDQMVKVSIGFWLATLERKTAKEGTLWQAEFRDILGLQLSWIGK